MPFLLVVFHHGSRRDFFRALSVSIRSAFQNVLILPLFFFSYSVQMLLARHNKNYLRLSARSFPPGSKSQCSKSAIVMRLASETGYSAKQK